MGEIFEVEVWNADHVTTLLLPATNYELLDVAERLGIVKEVAPSTSILEYSENFQNLEVVMEDDLDLFELNALAGRLSQFEPNDIIALHALLSSKLEGGQESIPVKELLDLAYSTDLCEVYPEVWSLNELGHFYVENGLVPELKGTPDSALQFLNYEEIGKKFCEAECGILVPGGYVTQTDKPKEVSKTMDFSPKKPDYTILLELTREGNTLQLQLPASLQRIKETLNAVGADKWTDPFLHVQCKDCAAPILKPILGGRDGIADLSLLSTLLQQMEPKTLTKYKAVLEAVEDWSLQGAIHIAEHLDDYILMDSYSNPEDMARDFLSHDAQDEMIPFVDLAGYGNYLMENQNGVMGSYGMVMRGDGLPLQPTQQQELEEMTMQ